MEETRISTKRLLLRPYEEADRDPVIRILRNKEISSTFMLPDFEDDAAALVVLFPPFEGITTASVDAGTFDCFVFCNVSTMSSANSP